MLHADLAARFLRGLKSFIVAVCCWTPSAFVLAVDPPPQLNYPYFEDDRSAFANGIGGKSFPTGFTFSGWFHFKGFAADYRRIFGNGWETLGFDSAANGDLTVWFKQESAGFPGIEKGQWINLAVTAGDGQVRFYRNGALYHEAPMADTSFTFSANGFSLGGYWGYAKQLKIWDRVLTQPQLQAEIAVADSTGQVPVHQWLMGEGVGSLMQDTGSAGDADFHYPGETIWKHVRSPYEILWESEIKVYDFEEPLPGGAVWGSADFDQDGTKEVFYHGLNDNYPGQPIPMLVFQVDDANRLVEKSADLIEGGRYYRNFVSGRKTVVADLNGDGFDDVFSSSHSAHAGVLSPEPSILLLSDGVRGYLSPADDRIKSPPCTLSSPAYAGQKPCQSSNTVGPLYPDESAPLVDMDLRGYSHGTDVADIDGDGDLDLFVNTCLCLDELPVTPYFLINDGEGNFTANWQMVPHKAFKYYNERFEEGELPGMDPDTWYDKDQSYLFPTFGDFDNDGHLDVALTGVYTEAASLRPPADPFDVETENPWQSIYELVAWGDETGFSEEYSILQSTSIPSDTYRALATEPLAMDIDGDGDLDLILNRDSSTGFVYPGSYLQIFRNEGGRVFADVTPELLPQTTEEIAQRPRSHSLAEHDLNRDGCPDFIAIQDFPANDLNGLPPFRIWLNDCSGGFRPVRDSLFGKVGMMIPLDVDGDGGLDFVSINRGVDTTGEYREATLIKQVAPIDIRYFADPTESATLMGTIVDAAGGEPVHPVYVWLWDPVAGSPVPGAGATNNPDGTYIIENLAPGDFVVVYDAFGPATGYIDELYDDVSCRDCDFNTAGDLLSIYEGVYEVNVDLVRGLMVSGIVTSESGEPLERVSVDLLDATGQWVIRSNPSSPSGEWYVSVPGPGTYYARIAPETAPGYFPEAWNDVMCDLCDPTEGGTPIVVGDGDVAGIDFELESSLLPEYHCRGSDMLFASDFEARPAREVAFTSNASGIITEAGQQVEFSVELLDDQGAVASPMGLDWCLTDTDNLELAVSGGTATVTATGMGATSVQLIVRDPASGEEARATVIFAELRDDASLLDDALFIDGVTPASGETGTIVLERTALTETLAPGVVIASGDRLGILVRILSVTVLADTVELVVEAAGLHDFYADVRIEAESAPQRFRIVNDGSGEAQLQLLNAGGRVKQAFTLFGFECSFDVLGSTFQPEFDVEFTTTELFLYELDPFFGALPVEMELISSGRVKARLDLDVQVRVGPQIDCKLDNIPALPVATLPAGPIPLLVQVKPVPGFSGSVTGGGTLFKLPTPIFSGNLAWAAGIRWDPVNSTQTVFSTSAFRAGWGFELRQNQEPQTDEYQAAFKPYVAANLGLGLVPGGPTFDLLGFEYGIPITAGINPPLSWRDRNYTGPSWKVERANEFKLADDLTDVAQVILEDKLGLVGATAAMLALDPVLYSDTVTWFESPSNPTLSVVCQPGDCPVDPARNDWFSWSLAFPEGYDQGEAEVNLVGWKDGAAEAVELDNDLFVFDGVNGQWYPNAGDIGNWTLRGMVWDRDLLNIGRYFPYPTVYDTQGYEVATSWQLNVLLPGVGKVTTAPSGIDCLWENYPNDCGAEFADGTEITLTAHEVPGYEFIGWDSGASPGYACEGSTSMTCVITISADTFAQPEYREIPSYTVSVSKQLAGGAPTGGGQVTSGDGFIDCGSTCAATYQQGANVSLLATDTPGANFVQWADDSPVCAGSINRTCAFTVGGDTTARAVFAEVLTLSVEKVSINSSLATTGGLVTSSPAGIECGDQCSASFSAGEPVVLTASDANGWSFRHWAAPSECATEAARELTTCEVTPNSSARAVFEPDPVTITDHSVGPYYNLGRPCPQFPTSADTNVTVVFEGAMEDGGRLVVTTYWDNQNDGVIDGSVTSNAYIPSNVAVDGNTATFFYSVCWGYPETVDFLGVKYVDPQGNESNERVEQIPRP